MIRYMNLIEHNCRGFGAVDFCDSDSIRDEMIRKTVRDKTLRTGFAWLESKIRPMDFVEWKSVANGIGDSQLVLSGTTCRILDDDYDYYALF